MAVMDPDALTQVLSSIEVRMGMARRITLDRADALPIPSDSVTLVYVADGVVHGHPPLGTGCRLDVDRASKRISATAAGDRSRLVAGDALISLGTRPFGLRSDDAASLVVFELELSDVAGGLGAMPEVITVSDFAGLEPAAAALAASMGTHHHSSPGALRSADPLICRMMATTVLLSAIRAWAENGCAPDAWLPGAKDPFLGRVVEAIHEEPGREWTVELLASVGAMSRSVFAERFRATVGSTPASYVTGVRMNTAKRMLESGMPVSTVARELGYASDEGFSRAFRRSIGMPPSAWRQSHHAPALA